MSTASTAPSFRLWGLKGGLGRASFVTLYAGLCLLPLLFARLSRDATDDALTELGAGLGMVAYTMLLLGFLLSGRFQFIAGRAGLDGILGMHRFLAFAATALIVAHIVVTRAADSGDAGPAAIVAVVALVLVIVLARARARVGLRYEYWRLSHGIAAVVVALAGFAHASADGYYSSATSISALWGVLLAIAIGSLIVVHVVRPLGRMGQTYAVVDVRHVAAETWQLAIEPTNGHAIDFEPGQYAFLALHRQPFMGSGHPFSFSSAPVQRPRIEFTVKENGDFTDTIGDTAPGTLVHLDGPHGYLSPARYRGPDVTHDGLVLIAGGVGIAPMMSILRQGAAMGQTKPALLVYAARTEADLAYTDELDRLTSELDLTVHYVLSDAEGDWIGTTGYVDEALLRSLASEHELGNRLYFVCGSTRMLESVLSAIDNAELAPADLVHAENFSVYD